MFRMARLARERSILHQSVLPVVNRRLGFFLTAAAALSTSLPSACTTDAFFTVRPSVPATACTTTKHVISGSKIGTTTRLYSSNSNNINDGILKRVAKSILPKKWFQSEEEQRAELARQRVRAEVKGGIQELLKDAPLPIRMMGSMVSPLLSRAASELSEGMAEQQRTVESVLEDARLCLVADPVARQALGGEPIQVGAPFSQSSSTSIINGQKSVNIALGFPVEGSRGTSGVAHAQANENGITQLILQVNGRQINVNLTKRGGTSSSSSIGKNRQRRSDDDDDNIIEAEIIEKDVKK